MDFVHTKDLLNHATIRLMQQLFAAPHSSSSLLAGRHYWFNGTLDLNGLDEAYLRPKTNRPGQLGR